MNAALLDAGEYWSYPEIAAYLGVAEGTVRDYASSYQPPFPEAIKVGRSKIWKAADIKAWDAERRGPGWRKGQD